MMKSIIRKHIVTVVVVSIAFLGMAFSIWRFEHLMKDKQDRVISVKEQLASYNENKIIFAEESLALAKITERVDALDKYRIRASTTPELLSSLEDLALKNNVKFSITTADNNVKGKLIIGFSASGSRTAIDSFLDQLSHQTYQIKFTKISIFADTIQSPESLGTPEIKTPVPKIQEWQVLANIEILSFDI